MKLYASEMKADKLCASSFSAAAAAAAATTTTTTTTNNNNNNNNSYEWQSDGLFQPGSNIQH
jgi:hypothetical protein